jgi:hypothetical protein
MIVIDGRALLFVAVLLLVMIYEKCKFDIWNDQRKERVREKTPRLCPALKRCNTDTSTHRPTNPSHRIINQKVAY